MQSDRSHPQPGVSNVANLILDMPRKWQKVNRVTGIALTKERFQFIFLHAHDLQDVLDKGMQTFNDWGLAIERWVEKPPPGYLQYVSIWVKISNIPVNHYTKPAITDLGGLIGHVELVAFDPEKSQRQDYVRVKIRIEVTKPLKKSRVLNLSGGDQTTIYFFYEKVQKRCTYFQILTHAKERCPLLVNLHNRQVTQISSNHLSQSSKSDPILSEGDPLFGVLQEDQVGINPISGCPRIAPEILQKMRNYLLASSNEEKHVREHRVIFSVKEAEKDPISQKAMLQLTPPLLFTTNLKKGKGVVFNFDKASVSSQVSTLNPQAPKLIASAISAGHTLVNSMTNVFCRLSLPTCQASSSQISELSPVMFSSPSQIKKKPKRKPGRYKRIPKDQKKASKASVKQPQTLIEGGSNKKRKAGNDLDDDFSSAKKKMHLADVSKAAPSNASLMVPHEGPSKA